VDVENDIGVEMFQLVVFLFHTLTDAGKQNYLLLVSCKLGRCVTAEKSGCEKCCFSEKLLCISVGYCWSSYLEAFTKHVGVRANRSSRQLFILFRSITLVFPNFSWEQQFANTHESFQRFFLFFEKKFFETVVSCDARGLQVETRVFTTEANFKRRSPPMISFFFLFCCALNSVKMSFTAQTRDRTVSRTVH